MITAWTRTLDGRPAPIRIPHPGPGGFSRAEGGLDGALPAVTARAGDLG